MEESQEPACRRPAVALLHYNFVKPHAALEGQTPAQRAGVGVEGNKWLALLTKSLSQTKEVAA